MNFVTILLLFLCFGFFGLKADGVLAPQPGIEPATLAWVGEALTTGTPEKSLFIPYSEVSSLLERSVGREEPTLSFGVEVKGSFKFSGPKKPKEALQPVSPRKQAASERARIPGSPREHVPRGHLQSKLVSKNHRSATDGKPGALEIAHAQGRAACLFGTVPIKDCQR